jgi:PhnB protein
MAFNPYLYFDGQCEEAFDFYEKCLDGKITFMMRWEASPGALRETCCGFLTLPNPS